MDLLRYSDTHLRICLKTKTKREIHDVLRQAFVHPTRMAVCDCVEDPWVRKTLEFLGVTLYNESSRQHVGQDSH
jgi:hypothetical protein